MIDFRYHVVSIVAVFLALAIGIVLGSTALREPVIDQLTATTDQLGADNERLRAELRTQEQQAKGNDEFVTAVTPEIVANRLDGERVVIVESPGTDETQRELAIAVLKEAGATVTGRLSIQDKYLADDEVNVIDELATRLKPPSVSLDGGTTYGRAAQVLAGAIMAGDEDSGQESAVDETVLSGFETAEYASGQPSSRATLAVMIAPSNPFTGTGAAEDNAALVALAQAVNAHGSGAVLAGPASSAAEGGLIRAVRDDGEAADAVTTVDSLDTAAGRVVTVLALEKMLSGRTGHLGAGRGAEGFLPTPYSSPEESPEALQEDSGNSDRQNRGRGR